MEENNENVVEETTQDTTQQVEETNKPNINEDGDYVVNLDKPIENETKEDNADDSGVVTELDNAESTEKHEEVQPEEQTQEETPVLEEITEEEVQEQTEELAEEVTEAIEKEKEDRKDERTRIQATQQSEMIDQRNAGKPPKNFESAGNDILGGGFDLGAFDPR